MATPEDKSQAQTKVCLTCRKEFQGSLFACPDDGGQLIMMQKDPLIGTVFADRYEILSVLGTGGMSIVYKARHKYMDRFVAVKLLLSHLIVDASAIQRFQQEAQAASSLSHPNIIAVYDFGVTADNQAFLVMDCLEGETLSEVLEREGHVSVSRGTGIFAQVCDGLDHAHRKGIIHRDLKPSNLVLLVQEDGSELVKLVDFGIAKFLPQDGKMRQQLTQTGQVFGSPLYMSPEQCVGSGIDARSDIYSLGCLMYEALTGIHPLRGATSFETMSRHVNDKPLPMQQAAPELSIPAAIDQVVLKCMEKDPEQRFQSAAEIRQSLPGFAMTLSGAQSLVTSGSGARAVSGQGKTFVAQPAGRTAKRVEASLVWALSLGAMFVAVIAYLIFWPGPKSDRGPIYKKIFWMAYTTLAEQSVSHTNYQLAKGFLDRAEQEATTFGDNHARLLTTLNMKSEVLAHLGMFPEQEQTNQRIAQLTREQILSEYRKAVGELKALDLAAGVAGVSESMTRLKAEANADRVTVLARKLYAARLYEDEQRLLRLAIRVYSKLISADYFKLADYFTELAESLKAQQRTPEVRPLLIRALEIRTKAKGEDDLSSIRALLVLGQWDRDQANYKEAGRELQKAFDLTSKHPGVTHEFMAECVNSFADYFNQLGQRDEARALFLRAKEIEEKMHADN